MIHALSSTASFARDSFIQCLPVEVGRAAYGHEAVSVGEHGENSNFIVAFKLHTNRHCGVMLEVAARLCKRLVGS